MKKIIIALMILLLLLGCGNINQNNNSIDSDETDYDGVQNAVVEEIFILDIDVTYKSKEVTKKDTVLVSIVLKKDGKVEVTTYGWSNEDDAVGGYGTETGTYTIEGNELKLHLTSYKSGVSMEKGKINRRETYIIIGNNQFEGEGFKFTKGELTEEDFT